MAQAGEPVLPPDRRDFHARRGDQRSSRRGRRGARRKRCGHRIRAEPPHRCSRDDGARRIAGQHEQAPHRTWASVARAPLRTTGRNGTATRVARRRARWRTSLTTKSRGGAGRTRYSGTFPHARAPQRTLPGEPTATEARPPLFLTSTSSSAESPSSATKRTASASAARAGDLQSSAFERKTGRGALIAQFFCRGCRSSQRRARRRRSADAARN